MKDKLIVMVSNYKTDQTINYQVYRQFSVMMWCYEDCN